MATTIMCCFLTRIKAYFTPPLEIASKNDILIESLYQDFEQTTSVDDFIDFLKKHWVFENDNLCVLQSEEFYDFGDSGVLPSINFHKRTEFVENKILFIKNQQYRDVIFKTHDPQNNICIVNEGKSVAFEKGQIILENEDCVIRMEEAKLKEVLNEEFMDNETDNGDVYFDRGMGVHSEPSPEKSMLLTLGLKQIEAPLYHFPKLPELPKEETLYPLHLSPRTVYLIKEIIKNENSEAYSSIDKFVNFAIGYFIEDCIFRNEKYRTPIPLSEREKEEQEALMYKLQQAEQEIQEGKGIPLEEAMKQIEKDISKPKDYSAGVISALKEKHYIPKK